MLFLHTGHATFDFNDVHYLQNDDSIFEEGLNGQIYSSLDTHHPTKTLSQQNFSFTPLLRGISSPTP